MSGGRLIVLDRSGRDVKQYELPGGLATLGSAAACDIRVLLAAVRPHHATVAVHPNQTVVRNISDGETLVNGCRVSVAALQHRDVITVGDRSLRWEYAEPAVHRAQAPEPALYRGAPRAGRTPRRASAAAAPTLRRASPALRLALEMHHRASMPGGAGGKQVAVVQPQRRHAAEPSETSAGDSLRQAQPQRPRAARNGSQSLNSSVESDSDRQARKASPRSSPKTLVPPNTTKATLWIESRKTSPRKSASAKVQSPLEAQVVRRGVRSARKATPLRMAVLRKVQSAQKMRVTKIEAPLKIDHTKQAAIMLMTGHTPKAKLPSPKRVGSEKTPSLVTKKASVVRKSPRGSRGAGAPTAAPARASVRASGGQAVSVLETTDSEAQNSSMRASAATRRTRVSFQGSPLLPSPKKSALKDPRSKKSVRKTESIKFDLSNLHHPGHEQSDVVMLTDAERDSVSQDGMTLHYDTSDTRSSSPGTSIHSRSSVILRKSPTATSVSPTARKSIRGSIMLQKASDSSDTANGSSTRSRAMASSVSDQSPTTAASARPTRTLSLRSPNQNLESYSIVDLVSLDSNQSANASVYDSVGSTRSSSIAFGTPRNTIGRRTRSTIDPNLNLLGSSTPYASASARSRSNPNVSARKSSANKSGRSSGGRRSKSLSTPENTLKRISVNSTRVSRSTSRIDDSELEFISRFDAEDTDESPKSSRRASEGNNSKSLILNSSSGSTRSRSRRSVPVAAGHGDSTQKDGTITPENIENVEEVVGTPVLSIRSLLDSSLSSPASQKEQRKTRASGNAKRKTIGALRSRRKKVRSSLKSKSLNISSRSLRSLRMSTESSGDSEKTDENAPQPDNEEMVTPKSAVKLVPEAVKNKHSTAKKPQSKRSIIDNLNESEIVKQLFNSPVKRKLYHSMTDISRKQLFEDKEVPRRATRHTVALTGRSPDDVLPERSDRYSPGSFVSPLSTPGRSPDLSGVQRSSSDSPARQLRAARTRKSVKNDLTNISGVKALFARSPRNRLSDVRVKEVFATSPRNDLRRVSGVRSLFQSQKKPQNDLSDVRGIRNLFKRKSNDNDLRNVSGVRTMLRLNSPRNDLTDVRGVRRLFRQQKPRADHDVSGIEEMFNEASTSRRESLFDRLIGKPPVKAVYSKSFVTKCAPTERKTRKVNSLGASADAMTNDVAEWLEQELKKRVESAAEVSTSVAEKSIKSDTFKANVTRELQKLTTNTVEGSAPIRTSRTRDSTITKSHAEGTGRKRSTAETYSAHTLPIKKRSLVERSLEGSIHHARSSVLPIKKRAVLHSTPMKGSHATMNASELGRVSPIAAVDQTMARPPPAGAADRSLQKAKVLSPRGSSKANNKAVDQEIQTKVRTDSKPSLERRRIRAKNNNMEKEQTRVQTEQPSGRVMRNRNISTNNKIPNAKNSPKPKAARKTKAKSVVENEQIQTAAQPKSRAVTRPPAPGQPTTKKVTRGTKNVVENKSTSESQPVPKKTRAFKVEAQSSVEARPTRSRRNKTEVSNAKKRRSSIVISKKTPAFSPKPENSKTTLKGTRKTALKVETTKEVKSIRRQKGAKDVVNLETPKKTRVAVQKLLVSVKKPEGAKTRGKKQTDEQPRQSAQSTRARRAKDRKINNSVETSEPGPTTAKRNRKTTIEKPNDLVRRGRKATVEKEEVQAEPPAKRPKGSTGESKKSVRRNKKDLLNDVVSQDSAQSKPTRTRAAKVENITVVPEIRKGRKRKLSEEQPAAQLKLAQRETRTRVRQIVIRLTEIEMPKRRPQRETAKRDGAAGRVAREGGDGDASKRRARAANRTAEDAGAGQARGGEGKPARRKKAAPGDGAAADGRPRRRAAAGTPPASDNESGRARSSRAKPFDAKVPAGGRARRR